MSLALPKEEPEAAVALTADIVPDEGALARVLSQAGLDLQKYGVGKAKSVAQLLKEIRLGESVLEWRESAGQLLRVVEPVFVQFRWQDSVLVEVEQRFPDGRSRQRNMLLAEKKAPEDASVCATAFRGVREELDLPVGFPLDRLCRFMPEAYCCATEDIVSPSYPGLLCKYVTHYCGVQLLEAGAPRFGELGRLADTFGTAEADKTSHLWKWVPVEEARDAKAKGFPVAHLSEGDDTGGFDVLESPPLEPAGLRALLEAGAVDVGAWGEYSAASLECLARELQTGTARLEREAQTGRVRRLLQPRPASKGAAARPCGARPGGAVDPDPAAYPGLPCRQALPVPPEGNSSRAAARQAPASAGGGRASPWCPCLGAPPPPADSGATAECIRAE